MSSLQGKIALVTGATSGIGEACAEALAERGCKLLLAARTETKLTEVAARVREKGAASVATYVLDVRDRKAVAAFGERVAADHGAPDILINNAGLARGLAPIQSGDIDDWEEMLDTNVKGLLYVTRAILPLMVARDAGHVVNIGSVAGLWTYPSGNVYCASKFAVDAITQGTSLDLVGTRIRVTEIDPGAVRTNFTLTRFHGDAEREEQYYRGYQPMVGADIAAAVMFALEAPEHVDIQRIVITPTAQRNPYVIAKKS